MRVQLLTGLTDKNFEVRRMQKRRVRLNDLNAIQSAYASWTERLETGEQAAAGGRGLVSSRQIDVEEGGRDLTWRR